MKLLKLIPLSLFFVVNFSPLKVYSHYFNYEKDCTEKSKDCFKARVKTGSETYQSGSVKETTYQYGIKYEHGDCIMSPWSGRSHSYSKSEKKSIECQPNY
tara:strand:- start:351 stop:650 length:300 start_codon:yes stop_codon:yes gene_type:complete